MSRRNLLAVWVRGSTVRDGGGGDMEPEAGTGAANGEKGGTTDDAASGEDAGVMSRATPSAGRPRKAGG